MYVLVLCTCTCVHVPGKYEYVLDYVQAWSVGTRYIVHTCTRYVLLRYDVRVQGTRTRYDVHMYKVAATMYYVQGIVLLIYMYVALLCTKGYKSYRNTYTYR